MKDWLPSVSKGNEGSCCVFFHNGASVGNLGELVEQVDTQEHLGSDSLHLRATDGEGLVFNGPSSEINNHLF